MHCKDKKKQSMFPVAHAGCILATKFACYIFVTHIPVPEKKIQSDFWPEHDKSISCVDVVNQIFVAVSDLFMKWMPQWPMVLFLCVLPTVLLTKTLHIAISDFSIHKMKT